MARLWPPEGVVFGPVNRARRASTERDSGWFEVVGLIDHDASHATRMRVSVGVATEP